MAVELPGSEEETAARAAITQAASALGERHTDIAQSFAQQLFGNAVPEDVAHYAPADLAALAATRTRYRRHCPNLPSHGRWRKIGASHAAIHEVTKIRHMVSVHAC